MAKEVWDKEEYMTELPKNKFIEKLKIYTRKRLREVPEQQVRAEIREKLLRRKLKEKALEEVKRKEREKVIKQLNMLKNKYNEVLSRAKTARTYEEKLSFKKQLDDLSEKIKALKKLYRENFEEDWLSFPTW